MNPCFKAALEYVELYKLPVIPCKIYYEKPGDKRAQKKPLVSWKTYQDRLPTVDELAMWWKKYPDASVGVVTGRLSGVFALDIDIGYDKEFVKSLNLPKNTPISQTPSGGYHVFYKYPEGHEIKTGAAIAGPNSHLDCRGVGGFLVVAPSTYPNGAPYKWLTSFDQYKPADAPLSLYMALGIGSSEKKRTNFREIATGGNPGNRNHSAASMVGLLTRYLPERYWGTTVLPLLYAWNEQNTPPLPQEEVYNVYMSICDKERFEKSNYIQKKYAVRAE